MDGESCPELTALTNCYDKLTLALPLEDLMPQLITQRVVNLTEKQRIMSKPSDKDRIEYFLDEILMKPLYVGDTDAFTVFLKVLKQNIKCKFLVTELERQLDLARRGEAALPKGE